MEMVIEIAERTQIVEVRTPRGNPARFRVRDGTTDLATVGSTCELWGRLEDEYGLRDFYGDGLFVDVGAHIGTVTIPVLLDNPVARAIAVEPLPENIALLAENAGLNGVADRLRIIEAAVGDGRTQAIRYGPDVHRYIGDIRGATGEVRLVPTVRLDDITDEPIDALKLDCEGGEWVLLDTGPGARGRLRRDLSRVGIIFGEYHGHGPDRLRALLERTHDVTILSDDGGTGLFRAVRR